MSGFLADHGREGADLAVGGVPARELARRYGTPLYAYDLGAVRREVAALRSVLPPGARILYSVKANPLLALLAFLRREGCGAEVASAGELEAARRAEIPPEEIVFAGPGKSRDEHLAALRAGIRAIHLESPGEADRLAGLAGRGGVAVGLRVNPSERLSGAGMRMGGGAQAFGIDEELLPDLLDRILDAGRLRVAGLHAYAGTQLAAAAPLAASHGRLLELAGRVADRLGGALDYVDLGGGFAVALHEGQREPDLAAWGRELAACWERHRDRTARELLVEPGRLLVARAGVFLTRIVDVKTSRGERILVLDGGMQANALAAQTMGQVFRKALPVCAASRLDAPVSGPARLVGPLCTPLDELGRDVPLPELHPGDLLAFLRCGAYAATASHWAFLSRPAPAEAVTLEGESWLARPARAEWLQGQSLPPFLRPPEREAEGP